MPLSVIDLSEEDEFFKSELDKRKTAATERTALHSALAPQTRSAGATHKLHGKRAPVIDLTGDCAFDPSAGPCSKRTRSSTPASKKGKSKQVQLNLEDDLSCAICMDLFLGPLSISCGHTFCQACLTACLEKDPTCPSCRQKSTAPPYRNLTLESIVDKYFLHQMDELTERGNAAQSNRAREERASRLKALEVTRIADQQKRPASTGRR